MSAQFGPRAEHVKDALAYVARRRREGCIYRGLFAAAARLYSPMTPQQINRAWHKYKHLPEYAITTAVE